MRLHVNGKAEVGDLISVDHLGLVLQGLGGNLSLKKVKKISPRGCRKSNDIRFNRLFNKHIQVRIYMARMDEADIGLHLVVIDSRH